MREGVSMVGSDRLHGPTKLNTVIEQMDTLEVWEQAEPNPPDVGAVGTANDAADGAEVVERAAEVAQRVVDSAKCAQNQVAEALAAASLDLPKPRLLPQTQVVSFYPSKWRVGGRIVNTLRT